MRTWPVFLVVSILLIPGALAEPEWLQLDDPPDENAGDAPDPVDMVDLFYATNTTHLFLREDLVSSPEIDSYTYVVYITMGVGSAEQDYRFVHALSGSYLELWDGTDWIFVEDITVAEDDFNHSLIFQVPVDSIGGLGDSHVTVRFENYQGADSFQRRQDRAPDKKDYKIRKKAIPNIPVLALPVFVGGLSAGVYLLRRKFTLP